MKHLWFIVLVSLVIGLTLVGPTLWRYRKEIKRTWGEELGLGGDDDAPREIESEEPIQWRKASLLAIICIAIAFLLGVAVSSGGAVALSVCAVCIVALVLLFTVVLMAHIK